jgi:glycosyltransferase involved in cell wall biosynthesis
MSIKDHKISVIVTTFNRKKLLLRTVNSILNQTHRNFELIIVDNFSDYDFMGFIESLGDSRIRPFQNDNNGIIAVNRNYGSMLSKSDFLAFCDDDDSWMHDKLEQQLEIMLANPELTLNATLARKMGFGAKFGQQNFGIMYRNVSLSRLRLIRDNPIITSSVLLRKNTFISLNGFSEDEEHITVEDLELWIRLFDTGKISILKQVLIKYEIHDNNITRSHFAKRLNFLRKNKINVEAVTLPFESNLPSYMVMLKSIVHLYYIIFYRIVHIMNKVFYINDRLLVTAGFRKLV